MDNALRSQRYGTPAFSQLQPTQIPQGSQSAGFTITEVLRIALTAQKPADIQRDGINALADKAKTRALDCLPLGPANLVHLANCSDRYHS
ncbi:hypothetical protein E4U11_006333 [Claviceps purpurea]|nr:hypothetical protein E4U11_006333 [Claviceps purpurea]